MPFTSWEPSPNGSVVSGSHARSRFDHEDDVVTLPSSVKSDHEPAANTGAGVSWTLPLTSLSSWLYWPTSRQPTAESQGQRAPARTVWSLLERSKNSDAS